MKFLLYILLFFLISCSTPLSGVKRIYICGDHPCKNDKEARDYFDNNISIEVYTISTEKTDQENFDLVELNLLEDKLKSKDKIKISEKEKEIKNKIKERKRLAKLKIKEVEVSKKPKEIIKLKEVVKKKKKSQITFIRICKNLEECDIDKISKIIMDIGKEKDFPDIVN
tara:strand:- start:3994 stop:4500 length:507 start_codon:yes stop_codon:yes gene_type:complete